MSESELLPESEDTQKTNDLSPEEAYRRVVSEEEVISSVIRDLQGEILKKQTIQEHLTKYRLQLGREIEEAEDRLAAHRNLELTGKHVIFSGDAVYTRVPSGKWTNTVDTLTFESAIGLCKEVKLRGSLLEMESTAQKKNMTLKDPAIIVRVEDTYYLLFFDSFQEEEVKDGPEAENHDKLMKCLEEPGLLEGMGLRLKKDVTVNTNDVEDMLPQWSETRERPNSTVIKEGTILRVENVTANDEDPEEIILEFETYETGGQLDGVRPQNANARMKFKVFIDSINHWEVVDAKELIAE